MISNGGAGRHGSYFYLSYAQSPPLAGSTEAGPDLWVRAFFGDLTAAVRRHASPSSGLGPGFFDQEIPLGADWKASLTQALGAAQVFVPLYSPGYFARSWPGREWACFYQRMADAEVADPLRRFAPVLWIPLLGDGEPPPALPETTAAVGPVVGYADNGLRALLRLRLYRESYQRVVDKLAAHIVGLAEGAPLEPSPVPNIDQIASAFRAEESVAVFAVTVAAPSRGVLSPGRDPDGYAEAGTSWRPYPRAQEVPLADYARTIAEQMDFAVLVGALEKPGDRLTTMPGVILIDPWFAAQKRDRQVLRSCATDLPPWVVPLLVLPAADDPETDQLARVVRQILGTAAGSRNDVGRRALDGVRSLADFAALMPILVAEAERQYLRHGPDRRPTVRPPVPPRRIRLAGNGPPDQDVPPNSGQGDFG